ncbi:MAG TPA: ABC transporter permease [Amycolatopsis sp.]|nr:ABC transporter permease [Amycolatopsis sp.]
MLPYLIAGLALGSIYAIASAGLVITYVSTGVLNLAFGSMAFFVARFYYWLHTEHGWSIPAAALLALVVLGPLLGAVLYLGLFRHLRQRSTLIKIVSTVGLSVALPPVAILLFGDLAIPQAPGLAPLPLRVFHVGGAAVNLDQVISYGFLVVVVLAGTLVLRFTDIGLKVRAMVESESLTELSGTSSSRVALGVWMVGSGLAGLAGVLIAPTGGLSIGGMTLLMVTAFAPVVAARLRSLPTAVLIALAMGVVTDVVQRYLPADSTLTVAIVPSIPFGFILLFLLYYLVRGGTVGREAARGGTLDAAIRPQAGERPAAVAAMTSGSRGLIPLLPLALAAILPAVLTSQYWLGLVAQGIAMALVLLSISLVTGEGGMIWLCQITFAGGGAITAGQLAAHAGWPPLVAAVAGGVLMAPVGVLIGALTVRLGDLYVALVTLSFGLLAQTLIFTRPPFYRFGAGVAINRPEFAMDDRVFGYVALGFFLLAGLVIVNLRRATTGMGISAVRWSPPAARTLGLNVVGLKVLLSGFAAFVAGLGGALLAVFATVAVPDSYDIFQGLVWLAVLVTIGSRSVTAALLAGLTFTVVPGVIATYLPAAWGNVPTILFGLGAVGVALHPEGVVATQTRQIQQLIRRRRRGSPEPVAAAPKLPVAAAKGDRR